MLHLRALLPQRLPSDTQPPVADTTPEHTPEIPAAEAIPAVPVVSETTPESTPAMPVEEPAADVILAPAEATLEPIPVVEVSVFRFSTSTPTPTPTPDADSVSVAK